MAAILITAGPTHEYLDDVRYLTNASSGRTGFALAAAAAAAGHRTILVAGPSALPTPPGVERIDVVSAREMRDRAAAAFRDCDLAFGVAAVADHRPAQRARGKPAKEAGSWSLELVPNPDVIATLAAGRPAGAIVVGFALQAEAGERAIEKARAKLARKGLDMVVLNAPATLGSERIRATLVVRRAEPAGGAVEVAVEELEAMPKERFAQVLLDRALALWSAARVDRGPRRAPGAAG
ncbi:MAG: hypothetical protein IPM29_01080 [Planctomycetes bacterium]|nr:hypothetical protein [Planctomycetota bacterium]